MLATGLDDASTIGVWEWEKAGLNGENPKALVAYGPTKPGLPSQVERKWKGSGKEVERKWKGSGKEVDRKWKGTRKGVRVRCERRVKGELKESERMTEI